MGEEDPRYRHPAWDRCTEVARVPAARLLLAGGRAGLVAGGRWAYWDYRRLADLLPPDQLAAFPWSALGLAGRAGAESTLWVGTRGAHTPCHQDTYGTNLVAQLVGTKTWTLFPPDEGRLLLPSRVPYEESSVYSRVNFTHPGRNSKAVLAGLAAATPHTITLSPGEVLFVPRHWWHFVTCEEFAISVNTWLEHPGDPAARLGEALVRVQAAALARTHPPELRDRLLNPKESDLADCDIQPLYRLCSAMADRAGQLGEPQDICQPDFGPDFCPVEPGQFPAPAPEADAPPPDYPEDPRLAVFRASTCPAAVEAAAAEFLQSRPRAP
jgi:HSPB1-associated protein 1